MARIAFYPNSSGTPFIPGKTYQIPEGGTGATTVADALIALGGISKATAGQVGGPVALDALAYAPVSCYPTGVGQSYTFTGPTALSGGATSSNTYTLTNYDAYTTYTLTPLSGSINSTSNGAGAVTLGAGVSTFTYIPPLRGTGTDGFKITTSTDSTGRSFSVTVNNSVVTTPSISMAFTTNLSEYPTITGSSYGGGTNTLSGQAMTKSRWQIASDSGFTTVLKDKSVTGTATSYTLVSADGALAHGTTYYARVQYACTYNGTDIWSDWSTGVAISTMAEFTLSVPSTNPPIGGQANTLTIQNYDSAATYSVSTSSGCSSVTVSGSTVNFTPNTAGTSYSITISDGHTGITQSGAVTASVVNTPSIASGVTNGQTGLGSSVTMVGSTPSGTGIYSTISSYTATWNLYTNSSYTGTPTTQTVSNATSVTFSGLSANTTYYAQVRYSVGTGVSSFSHGSGSAFSFMTKSSFYMTGTQQAQLLVSTGSGLSAGNSDYFGWSVALSSDGNTALIGAYNRGGGTGAAYVFTRSGTTWGYQTQLLISTGSGLTAATSDLFGVSVALSADGNTALIGAYGRNLNAGAAYVFTRSGTTWSYQKELLISTGSGLSAATYDYFGWSVALSSDGNTALIGAYNRGGNAGAAYVFTRSGTTWSYQKELLISTGSGLSAAASDYFGRSIALSGDGNTALIGAYGRDTGATNDGAAYVFTRSGTTWSYQKELLISTGSSLVAAVADLFGYSVALSNDGNTALIGCINRDTGATNDGAAYVFTRSGTTWSYQKELLISTGSSLVAAVADVFGHSVALSSDGNTALIGAYGRNTYAGAAYVFTRSGTTWSYQKELLISTGSGLSAATYDYFGWSVALSSDGNTALIGADSRDTGAGDAGAVYVYV